MNSQWSLYVNALDVSTRDRYEKKLEYGDGAGKLPDPYLMQVGWQSEFVAGTNVRRYLPVPHKLAWNVQ